MRLGAGACRHAHQADDHAIALDAGAIGGRIVRPAQDVIHLGEIEDILAGAGALGTGRARACAVGWTSEPPLHASCRYGSDCATLRAGGEEKY